MPFQRGQSGNPGGKPGPARQELSALLDRVFTPSRRKRVLVKLIEDAEAGQHDARVLLLAYAYGKPKDQIEQSGDLTVRVIYDRDSDPSSSAP